MIVPALLISVVVEHVKKPVEFFFAHEVHAIHLHLHEFLVDVAIVDAQLYWHFITLAINICPVDTRQPTRRLYYLKAIDTLL